MALSAVKSWSTGEILTASDLNAEFANILDDDGVQLGWPATGSKNFNAKELILDANGDSSITADTDDRIDLKVGGVDLVRIDATAGSPINGIDIVAGLTTAAPTIQTNSENDIGIIFANAESEEMLILASGTTAVNELTIASTGTGVAPTITSSGEDDIGIVLQAKNAEEMLILAATTAAVNEVTITSAATGNPATIAASGEANAPLKVETSTAGTGDLEIEAGGDLILDPGAAGAVKLGNAAISFPNSDGSANQVLLTDGSAAVSFSTPSYASGGAAQSVLPFPSGHLYGLTLSRNTASTIGIAAGESRGGPSSSNQNAVNMLLSSSWTKSTSSWASGDANGGYAGAAAIATDTWYHVFVIENGSGTIDFGFDNDVDAANLLSTASYTNYRRLGAFLTDPSTATDIVDFNQVGDMFLLAAAVDENPSAPTTAAQNHALTVPLGIRVEAIFSATFGSDSKNDSISFYTPDIGDSTAPSTSNGLAMINTAAATDPQSGHFRVLTNTSSQIGYRGDAGTGSATLEIATLGWIDRRGRDA